MLTNDEMDKYADYLNDIFEGIIEFDYIKYNNLINELKNTKEMSKPNGDISLYIDYLFDAIKNPKLNNKIRKFKLKKIMTYNESTN